MMWWYKEWCVDFNSKCVKCTLYTVLKTVLVKASWNFRVHTAIHVLWRMLESFRFIQPSSEIDSFIQRHITKSQFLTKIKLCTVALLHCCWEIIKIKPHWFHSPFWGPVLSNTGCVFSVCVPLNFLSLLVLMPLVCLEQGHLFPVSFSFGQVNCIIHAHCSSVLFTLCLLHLCHLCRHLLQHLLLSLFFLLPSCPWSSLIC